MADCLFCKFISNEIKVDKLYEDDDMIIINDISPRAKLHYLLIVKQHFAHLSDMSQNQGLLVGKCLYKLGRLTHELGLTNGYRVIINQGSDGGQTINHLHIHILGGQVLD